MGLVVDPTTGAVVDDGIPADDGMLPMPAPVPVAQPPMDPAAAQAVIDGFEASQQPQAAPEQPPPPAIPEQVGPGSQLAGLRGALRGQPLAPDKAKKESGEQFSGTTKPVAKPHDWAGGEGNRPGPGGGAVSISASTKSSGFSDANARKVAEVYDAAGVPAALDQMDQQNLQDTELQNKAAQSNYEAQVATIGASAAAEQERADRETQAALQYEQGLADVRRQWEADVAAAKRAEAQAKTRYEQGVAHARAMAISPGLGRWQGVAATFAMAGYSWLSNAGPGAPKLVDIPAMIDQIVANSMNAQQANIANAWAGVKADEGLISMAQQDAADADEAALRLKGMLLEQYTATVQTSAAMFAGSQPAIAAAQALADAQADHAANLAKISAGSFARGMKVAEERKKYGDSIVAGAQALYQEQMALKRAYAQRPKDKPAPPPHGQRYILYIKGKDGKFEPYRALNIPPDAGTTVAADMHKALQGISVLDSLSEDTLAAAAAIEDKYRGPGARVLADDKTALADYNQWKALLSPIVRTISGSGASLTGAEVDDYNDARAAESGMESFEAWLSGDDNLSRKTAGAVSKMRSTLVAKVLPYTREVTPTDLANEAAIGAYSPTMPDYSSDPTITQGEDAYKSPEVGDPYPKISEATARAVGLTGAGQRNAASFTPTALGREYTSTAPADSIASAVEAVVPGGSKRRFQKLAPSPADPVGYLAGLVGDAYAGDVAEAMTGTYPAYITDVVDLWRVASLSGNDEERRIAEEGLNTIAGGGIPESAAAADFALSNRFDPAWYSAPTTTTDGKKPYRSVPR